MEKKIGRPKFEGDKRTLPLNLRITERAKKQLREICTLRSGISETQVIIELIDKEAKRLRIPLP